MKKRMKELNSWSNFRLKKHIIMLEERVKDLKNEIKRVRGN